MSDVRGLGVYSDDLIMRQVAPVDEHITFSMGLAVNFQTYGASVFQFMSDETATVHAKLILGLGGQLHAYAGPGLSLVGSSSKLLSINNWNYIEMTVTLSSSTGQVVVNVNNEQVIWVPGINTFNPSGTKSKLDSIGIGADTFLDAGGFTAGASKLVDDHYLTNGAGSLNTGMVGDMNVEVLRPSANGDLSELVNSNGNSTNNYTYVNAPHYQTTTFVESDSPDAEDTYQMDNLPLPVGTVLAVQTVLLAQKNNTGDRQVVPIIRESGTDYAGPTSHLGTTLNYYAHVFEQDPATSTQWTVAGVNGAQMGVRVE